MRYVWLCNRPDLRNLFAQMDYTKRQKTTKNAEESREKEKIRKEWRKNVLSKFTKFHIVDFYTMTKNKVQRP